MLFLTREPIVFIAFFWRYCMRRPPSGGTTRVEKTLRYPVHPCAKKEEQKLISWKQKIEMTLRLHILVLRQSHHLHEQRLLLHAERCRRGLVPGTVLELEGWL